jgi:hypothetical protein
MLNLMSNVHKEILNQCGKRADEWSAAVSCRIETSFDLENVTPIYHTNCFTNFHSSRPIPVKRKVEDDDSERYKAFLVASTHITSHEEDYTFPSNNSMK